MSSKGTSWAKEQHEYDKKINQRYYYDYERLLKKLWRYKKNKDPRYEQAKKEYDENKKTKKKRSNEFISEQYNKLAEKAKNVNATKTAEEFTRRANDLTKKVTNSDTVQKVNNVVSDIWNISLLNFKDAYKKGKKIVEQHFSKGS